MAAILDSNVQFQLRGRDVATSFTLARQIETPVSTMIKKGAKPKSTLYEWLYRTPLTPEDSAVADGQDVADGDIGNNEDKKTMLQGRVQKGWVGYGVGDVAQEFVDEFGVSNLLMDNAEDAMNKAKENLELMILKNSDSRPETGSTSGTAGKMRGLTAWIASSSPADLPIPSMALTPSGNIVTGKSAASNVTEDDFRGVMQSVATTSRKTGFSWDVFLTPASKANFSNFTRHQTVTGSTQVSVRSFNAQQADKKLTLNITIYESDFGNLRLHTHFSLPSGVHALIADMSSIQLRPGRGPQTVDLPFNGGAVKKVINYIYGLQVDNPKNHGKITT